MTKPTLFAAMLGVAALAVAAPASAYEKGDWVLGKWKNDKFWFPAVVVEDDGADVVLRYDDGTKEVAPKKNVKAYDWKVGSKVSCRWSKDDKWYAGTITKLKDADLTIKYDDDGTVEATSTGRCRSE